MHMHPAAQAALGAASTRGPALTHLMGSNLPCPTMAPPRGRVAEPGRASFQVPDGALQGQGAADLRRVRCDAGAALKAQAAAVCSTHTRQLLRPASNSRGESCLPARSRCRQRPGPGACHGLPLSGHGVEYGAGAARCLERGLARGGGLGPAQGPAVEGLQPGVAAGEQPGVVGRRRWQASTQRGSQPGCSPDTQPHGMPRHVWPGCPGRLAWRWEHGTTPHRVVVVLVALVGPVAVRPPLEVVLVPHALVINALDVLVADAGHGARAWRQRRGRVLQGGASARAHGRAAWAGGPPAAAPRWSASCRPRRTGQAACGRSSCRGKRPSAVRPGSPPARTRGFASWISIWCARDGRPVCRWPRSPCCARPCPAHSGPAGRSLQRSTWPRPGLGAVQQSRALRCRLCGPTSAALGWHCCPATVYACDAPRYGAGGRERGSKSSLLPVSCAPGRKINLSPQ